MAFAFVQSVTIDHTQVPADQSDFPVLILGTYAFLRTVANGGNVQNSNGYDIVFATDNAGTSLLAWEIVNYSATTGAVEYWVKIPSLSSTVDTVIYLCYGDAAVVTDQSNKTAVWSSGFQLVHHYPNGSSLALTDSTSNANNGSVVGTVTAGTGQIDGGAVFSDSVDGRISVPAAASLNNLTNGVLTLSLWVYFAAQNGQESVALSKSDGDVAGGWLLWLNGLNIEFAIVQSSFDNQWTLYPAPPLGQWNKIDVVYGGPPLGLDNAVLYLNGVATAWPFSPGSGTHASDAANTLQIGESVSSIYITPTPLGGTLDEVRISNRERTAEWIATEYNNQNSPDTFYFITSPEPPPPGVCIPIPVTNTPLLIAYDEPLELTGS